MAEIKVTGNDDIDTATAEIAVALRAEHPGSNDEYCYRQAERLRDAIMAGALELDDHECIGQDEAEHIHDVAMWQRQHGKRPPIIDAYGAYPDRS